MVSFFWESLEAGGERVALITERESVSYRDLVERIARVTDELRASLPEVLRRPLVLLEAVNELDAIVAYLACLRAGFPVILVAEGQGSSSTIVRTYEPNVVFRRDPAERAVFAVHLKRMTVHKKETDIALFCRRDISLSDDVSVSPDRFDHLLQVGL